MLLKPALREIGEKCFFGLKDLYSVQLSDGLYEIPACLLLFCLFHLQTGMHCKILSHLLELLGCLLYHSFGLGSVACHVSNKGL